MSTNNYADTDPKKSIKQIKAAQTNSNKKKENEQAAPDPLNFKNLLLNKPAKTQFKSKQKDENNSGQRQNE